MDAPWIELGLFSFLGTIALGLAYAWLFIVPREREEKKKLHLARLAQHRAAWAQEKEKRARAAEIAHRRRTEAAKAAKAAAERRAAVEEHKKNVAKRSELRKQKLAQRTTPTTEEPTE